MSAASQSTMRISPPDDTFGFLRAIEPTGTTRIEALSDGVFAVAMTLLVLDLKLPPCLPFATSLAGEYPRFSLSAAIYVGNLLAMHLVYRGLWHHATHRACLMRTDLDPAVRKSITQRFNFYSCLVIGALGLSYFDSMLSIGVIVAYQFSIFFGQPIVKGRAV
jgi:uncharacterized membrane protein